MGKMNNVIRIPTSLNGNFFKYWYEFLRPYHSLTDREIEVAAAFTRKRFELSKVIKDDNILEKVVMSEDTKRSIREECNLSLSHFQVILGKLRKHNVLIENRLNPKFIPNIEEGQESFRLLLNFELN